MKVTTITPVYNGEKYLEECIQSLVSQTYHDIQFIFVDDGSTDSSYEILTKYKQNYDITVMKKPLNEGIAAAYNDALKIANGEVLCFLDQDDIATKNRVQKTVAEFQKDPELLVVYSDIEFIGPNGISLSFSSIPDYVNKSNLFFYLFRRSFFTGSIMSIRNDERINFDLDVICLDYLLSLRFAEQSKKFCVINEPLTKYRIHNQNTSTNINKMFQDVLFVQNQYSIDYLLEKWSEQGNSLSEIYTNIGINYYYYKKDYECAKKFFLTSQKIKKEKEILENPFYLGCICFKMGFFENSFLYFSDAFQIDQNRFECIHNLGILLCVLKKDTELALKMLIKAKEIQSNFLLIQKNIDLIKMGDLSNLRIIHLLYDKDQIIRSFCELSIRG